MNLDPPQALFLDRDGTLIKWVDFLHEPSQVVLEPGIVPALWKVKAIGCLLFLHTNQSGVGRGYFPMSSVQAVNDEMFRQMGVGAEFFDGLCIAPDSPAKLENPSYRKPNPRFELEMIEKYGLDKRACYFVGDRLSDVETGVNAGIKSVGIVENDDAHPFKVAGAMVFPSVAKFVDSMVV